MYRYGSTLEDEPNTVRVDAETGSQEMVAVPTDRSSDDITIAMTTGLRRQER